MVWSAGNFFPLRTVTFYRTKKYYFFEIQTMIKSRYNESSYFSNNLMKLESFRAGGGGGGKPNLDKD